MALKITLKPQEKMIVGGAVITNGNKASCELNFESKVPILREKDILSENDADTPCRQLYFIIQLIYIDEGNQAVHQKKNWDLVSEIVNAAPCMVELLDLINEEIISGHYYQALKLAHRLIDYEQEVISRVQQPIESIRKG